MKEIRHLKPFGRFCVSLGMIPTSYKESLSYEEHVLWLCNYIEKELIPSIENNNEAVEELQRLYNTLKIYVDNYFDNLDVQDEINNKLDEMASSGELAELINKSYYNVKLQNQLLYENGNGYKCQGMALDNHYLYVCEDTNFPNGNIKIYDLEDKSYINTYSNLPIYHANDCCINNEILYIATCKNSDLTLSNKKIARFNITNHIMDTEINPFNNTSYNNIWGIANIDNTNILCALAKGNETFNDIGLFILNPNDLSYNQIEIDTNNFDLSYYTYHQSIEYKNGYIYILTSGENSIITLKLVDNNSKAIVSSINKLGYVDELGQYFGEFEGFTKNNNDLYISTRIIENSHNDNEVVKVYKFNPYTNLSTFIHPVDIESVNGLRNFIYVNNSSNLLFEDGTITYPFKTIDRAITSYINKYPIPNILSIRINGGNNYSINKIDHSSDLIVEVNDNLTNKVNIDLSNFNLNTGKLRINGNDKTNINNLRGYIQPSSILEIDRCNITISTKISPNKSIVRINNCTVNSSITNDYTFHIQNNSILDFRNSTIINDRNKFFYVSGGGELYINSDLENRYDKTDNGYVILPNLTGAKNYIDNISLLVNNIEMLSGNNNHIVKYGNLVIINLNFKTLSNVNWNSSTNIIDLPAEICGDKNTVLNFTSGFTTTRKVHFAFIRTSDHVLRVNTNGQINSGEEFTISGVFYLD